MRITRTILAALIPAVLCSFAFAQRDAKDDPALLEKHLDGIAPDLMRRLYAPRMAIAVVKDGKEILSKGYGISKVETRKPVDPAATIFRIGSITRVFTAKAALQIVDKGKLDLESDVSEYIGDLKIEGGIGKITLRHLLSHTSGLDEFSSGRRAESPDGVMPLAALLNNDRDIYAAFEEDKEGRIVFLFTGSNAYERLSETPDQRQR